MDDQKQQEDRWAELAALLGVSGDAQPAAKPAPPVAPSTPPAPPPPALFEPSVVEMASDVEDEFIDEEDLEPQELDVVAAGDPEVAVGTTPAADDDKPQRGRRRRRRGRRRGGERGPEGKDEGPENARPPRPVTPRADAAPPMPRDRHQSFDPTRAAPVHQDREQFDDADADEIVEESPVQQAAFPDEDLDFSDWNVPSWQDLISSLHRPGR